MEQVRPPQGSVERFLARWRSLVAFLAVSRIFGRFSFGVDELTKFDVKLITPEIVRDVWGVISAEMGPIYKTTFPRNSSFVEACCQRAADAFGIKDIVTVGRQALPEIKRWKKKRVADSDTPMEDWFVDAIDAALPPQPWKPGITKFIAESLKCSHDRVSAAIQILIAQGRRNSQRDGIVYGPDGAIIAIDAERQPRPGIGS